MGGHRNQGISKTNRKKTFAFQKNPENHTKEKKFPHHPNYSSVPKKFGCLYFVVDFDDDDDEWHTDTHNWYSDPPHWYSQLKGKCAQT